MPFWFAPALLILLLSAVTVRAQSTISTTGLSHAYGANTGWINCRPSSADGIVATGFWLSGHAHAANFGWISFGNGVPVNGYAYANNSATDFGVNHDGAGNLNGYAYGANIGWINFGWTTPTDPLRPRIDLLTGDFSGYAYSANTGWINLGAGYLRTATLAFPDNDGDGIADAWEMQWFGSLTVATANSDADHDGATDRDEFESATDPLDPLSRLSIVWHQFDGDQNGFTSATLLFGPTSPSRLYRIRHSFDLQTWTDSSLGFFAPDSLTSNNTLRTISLSPSLRRFFRVESLLPLQP